MTELLSWISLSCSTLCNVRYFNPVRAKMIKSRFVLEDSEAVLLDWEWDRGGGYVRSLLLSTGARKLVDQSWGVKCVWITNYLFVELQQYRTTLLHWTVRHAQGGYNLLYRMSKAGRKTELNLDHSCFKKTRQIAVVFSIDFILSYHSMVVWNAL